MGLPPFINLLKRCYEPLLTRIRTNIFVGALSASSNRDLLFVLNVCAASWTSPSFFEYTISVCDLAVLLIWVNCTISPTFKELVMLLK